MKNIKIILLLLVFAATSYAQNSKAVCGFVKYSYIRIVNKTIQKQAILYFNDSTSKFIFDKTGFDENQETAMTNDGKSANVSFVSVDEEGSCIYRNFNNKEVIEREAKMGKIFDSHLYNDAWIAIDWQITNDTATISKFKCKKAIGNFRGRKYIVWFTEQVPLPYGPWKLFGLPGLIIEAQDDKKEFKIVFQGLKYPTTCEGKLLAKPTASETKTLKEHVDFSDNREDYFIEKVRARLPRGITIPPQKTNAKNGRKFALEQKFEWEK
jgi:GLPGLI family protein